jgi:hypothetical protein
MNWRDKIKELIKDNDQLVITEKADFIRIDGKEQSNCYLTCSFTRDGENLVRADFSRLIKNENGVVLAGDIEAVFDLQYPDSVKFIQNESEYKTTNLKMTPSNLRAFENFVSIPLYYGWTEETSLVDNEPLKIRVAYLTQDRKAKHKTIFLLLPGIMDLPLVTDYVFLPFVFIYLNIKYLFSGQRETIEVKPLINNNRYTG